MANGARMASAIGPRIATKVALLGSAFSSSAADVRCIKFQYKAVGARPAGAWRGGNVMARRRVYVRCVALVRRAWRGRADERRGCGAMGVRSTRLTRARTRWAARATACVIVRLLLLLCVGRCRAIDACCLAFPTPTAARVCVSTCMCMVILMTLVVVHQNVSG